MADLPTTRWSLVLKAGAGAAPDVDAALAELCRTYWYPVYAFVRSRTRDAERAKDTTQSFFTTLLEKNFLGTADPERGRFRAFLLTLVRRFMASEWERERALKRGGGKPLLSLDFNEGETLFSLEPADTLTPDRIYERRWALTLLDRVLGRLAAEYETRGNAELFEVLKPVLVGGVDRGAYAEFAARLGRSEGAVKTAVHRLKSRYRELLRDEVLQTVADPDEVDREIRHLLEALRG